MNQPVPGVDRSAIEVPRVATDWNISDVARQQPVTDDLGRDDVIPGSGCKRFVVA